MANANATLKTDPLSAKFYRPVQIAERWSGITFWLSTTLSFAILFADRVPHPWALNVVQIAFLISAVAFFALNHANRLYWQPRAEDKRRQDFLSHAFDEALILERSQGYYNNSQTDPFHRIAAQAFENALFTMRVIAKMAKTERAKLGFYVFLWLVAVLNRTTDLGLIGVIALAVFSEELISRWLRVEWLRVRSERAYEDLFRLFQSGPGPTKFAPIAIECFSAYEMAKANAGVMLSEKVFNRLNKHVSEEWEQVRALLKV